MARPEKLPVRPFNTGRPAKATQRFSSSKNARELSWPDSSSQHPQCFRRQNICSQHTFTGDDHAVRISVQANQRGKVHLHAGKQAAWDCIRQRFDVVIHKSRKIRAAVRGQLLPEFRRPAEGTCDGPVAVGVDHQLALWRDDKIPADKGVVDFRWEPFQDGLMESPTAPILTRYGPGRLLLDSRPAI